MRSKRSHYPAKQALAEPKRMRIEDIQRIVARHYNVSRADLLSSQRTTHVVRPRQVAMYLARTLKIWSLPEIGRRFGRDHTTVLHAVRKIGNDSALAEEIGSLKRRLSAGLPRASIGLNKREDQNG